MPISAYVASIRSLVGRRLLVLPAVTAVISDGRDRFLLAHHVDGDKWSLVGGGIEPEEAPRTALRREVQEELGVDVEVFRVIDSYGGADLTNEYPNGDVVNYVTTAYECRLRSEVLRLERAELRDARWFTRGEVESLDRFEWIDRVLDDAIRMSR